MFIYSRYEERVICFISRKFDEYKEFSKKQKIF